MIRSVTCQKLKNNLSTCIKFQYYTEKVSVFQKVWKLDFGIWSFFLSTLFQLDLLECHFETKKKNQRSFWNTRGKLKFRLVICGGRIYRAFQRETTNICHIDEPRIKIYYQRAHWRISFNVMCRRYKIWNV